MEYLTIRIVAVTIVLVGCATEGSSSILTIDGGDAGSTQKDASGDAHSTGGMSGSTSDAQSTGGASGSPAGTAGESGGGSAGAGNEGGVGGSAGGGTGGTMTDSGFECVPTSRCSCEPVPEWNCSTILCATSAPGGAKCCAGPHGPCGIDWGNGCIGCAGAPG